MIAPIIYPVEVLISAGWAVANRIIVFMMYFILGYKDALKCISVL